MSEFISPAVQAMNLIRYIGDQVSESGKPIPHLDGISQEIGAPSKELANQLIKELHEHDLIIMGEPSKETLGPRLPNVIPLPGGNSTKRKNEVSSLEITVSSPCSSTIPLLNPLFGTL